MFRILDVWAVTPALPIAHGPMEIGERVPLDELKAAMEDWFRRKGYISKQSGLRLNA